MVCLLKVRKVLYILENHIKINGAREHNLKNIDVEIPHSKLTVISGVSGSGKSTLAYDIIYATGQKRLLDCLSEQVKVFTSQLKQPDINYIKGLTPVVSLKQYKPRKNPRATIGTLSEVSTYLRYLYSLIGQARCPHCNRKYNIRSINYLIKELQKLPEKTILELQFPIFKNESKKYDDFFNELRERGYKKIEIDGERKDLRDWIQVDKKPESMMVVANKIQIKKEFSRSDVKAVQKAIEEGHGFVRIVVPDLKEREKCEWFFQKHGCPEHGMFAADILPSFFSFNDLNSACGECNGTGISKTIYPSMVVKDKRKSLKDGALFPTFCNKRQAFKYVRMFSLAKHFGFSFEEPFEILPDYAKEIIFYGTKGKKFPLMKPNGYNKELPKYIVQKGEKVEFEGIISRINREYLESKGRELKNWEKDFYDKFMVNETCQSCHGTRLKPQRQYIEIKNYNFYELGNMELKDLKKFIDDLEIPVEKEEALLPVIHELRSRLDSLVEIGLGYLSLNRRADTLSGGEYQRVRMAGQIGSDLMGLTYIIDEPTVGLHGTDNIKVINLLEKLCKQGNTVITIEHDLDIIKRADYLIEMGPAAGVNGGEIIGSGTVEDVMNNDKSVIATFLNSEDRSTMSTQAIFDKTNIITIVGAEENNLKNIDVSIPLNSLVCLTGISGSGKSSLGIEILYKAIWSKLHDPRVIPGKHRHINGLEKIKDVYCIDQSSVGNSPRSTPATYIGVFDRIRDIFAATDDAKKYGLDNKSYYSFNSKGACSSCKGMGYLDSHIHYLGDLKTTCPECKGKQYSEEVLEVLYKGKNIKQILEMDFEEALSFFGDNEYIHHKISYVYDLGLGYMKLGQPTNTISGGEAQRLCLAKEIGKIRGTKNMLYIMDEPTTGLHSKDIKRLIRAIRSLTENGNSVLVIEHNTDVIKNADYIIDMGPGAGKHGGQVVVAGTLQDIIACQESKTGQYISDNYHRTLEEL